MNKLYKGGCYLSKGSLTQASPLLELVCNYLTENLFFVVLNLLKTTSSHGAYILMTPAEFRVFVGLENLII